MKTVWILVVGALFVGFGIDARNVVKHDDRERALSSSFSWLPPSALLAAAAADLPKRNAILAALIGSSGSATPSLQTQVPLTVDPTSQRLLDGWGRESIFHGGNVVYKAFPYLPISDHFDVFKSFAEEDAQLFYALGMNAMRLGTIWSGVQPEEPPANFNYTFLAGLRSIVDLGAKYNVHSLLDGHQDILSRRYCGEGIPIWATVDNTTAEQKKGAAAAEN